MDNIKHSVEDLSNFFNCYITFLEKDTLTLSSKKPEYEYGKWPYVPDNERNILCIDIYGKIFIGFYSYSGFFVDKETQEEISVYKWMEVLI